MNQQAATTRWRQIETLFHQTAEINPHDRAAFLDQVCQGDFELRAELESLLASSDQTLSDLRGSVAAAAGDVLDSAGTELARIGPYRLIRTLRVGGMGTVYLSERDDAWETYSSRRWKTNIETLPNALSLVEKMRGVSYDRKDTGKHEIGVIAEEVGAVVPEVVTREKNGKDARSVDYSRLTALLTEATKEQQALVDKQAGALATALRQIKSQQA